MKIYRYSFNLTAGTSEITDTFETTVSSITNKVYLSSDDPQFKSGITILNRAVKTDCRNSEVVEVFAINETEAARAVEKYIHEKRSNILILELLLECEALLNQVCTEKGKDKPDIERE